MTRPSTLLSLSITALLATSVTGQTGTVYDDFNGKTIDKTKWFVFGDSTKVGQANGSLSLFGRGYKGEFGVLALESLDRSKGAIEVVLEFSGFRAGGMGKFGETGFELFAFDPEAGSLDRDISIGLTTSYNSGTAKWETRFDGELEKTDANGKETYQSGSSTVTTATSGQVRFRVDTKNTASVSYRLSSKGTWKQLASFTNFFVSNYVSFGIDVGSDDTDGPDVLVDKVTLVQGSTPTVKKSVITYGTRCQGLGAISIGYPRVGNTLFQLLAVGGPAFRGDTWVLALGLTRAALPWAGAPGCTLYVQPLFVVPGSAPLDKYGEGWATVAVPNNNALRGLKVVAQVAATTNRNPAKIALSNGIELKIW